MNKKTDSVLTEISEICANSLKDSNKKIYLEKILRYCKDHTNISKHIWDQNGIPLLLLQEITDPYEVLGTQRFTKEMSDNLSVVLRILYYLVKNDEIKRRVVDARIHFYLFRYVTIYENTEVYEKPRQDVLRILSTLVTDSYVQNHIKNTEIVPIILKNIDLGSVEVKCLSMETFYNLLGEEGLNYVTQTFDRFSAVNQVFNSICGSVSRNKIFSVIRWILLVYIRLCNKKHIRQALISKSPDNVVNEEMKKIVNEDNECNDLYKQLLSILNKS